MYQSQSALTLLEALIALAVVSIVVSISLPGVRHFLMRAQDDILQGQLLQAIETAKQEASIRHAMVAICQSRDQETCSGTWEDGLLIFLNENGDGVIHRNEQILAVMQTSSKHGVIHWRSFPAYRNYLLFSPAGLMKSDNPRFGI